MSADNVTLMNEDCGYQIEQKSRDDENRVNQI